MTKPIRPADPVPEEVVRLLEGVRARADAAGVFDTVRLDDAAGRLSCRARASAEPAEYRIDVQQGRLWVSLVTANRWLSESIETDLLHTGDKLDELIEEELVELGVDVKSVRVGFEHFRSDDKLFTFRTPLPFDVQAAGTPVAVETALKWLLAYEACFRRLGDMEGSSEE